MNNIAICDKWKRFDKNFETCKLQVSVNPLRQTVIEGIIKDPLRSRLLSLGKQTYIQYWAPSPPDYRHSYIGSELPFPCEDIAYSNSPNIGRSLLGRDGSFKVNIKYPNSYYKKMGAEYMAPHMKFLVSDEDGNMYGKLVNVSLIN